MSNDEICWTSATDLAAASATSKSSRPVEVTEPSSTASRR